MRLSKPLGILTGFAVAVGSISPFCCSYSDIPVHADFGNFVDSVDYITSATGTDAVELNESPVAGWILLLYALQQFYTDYQIDIVSDASQFSEISGTYINTAGEEKFCSVFLYPSWTNPSNSLVAHRLVALADDFALVASIPVSASFQTRYVTSNNNYFVDIGGSGSDNNITSSGTTVLPGTIYQYNSYYHSFGTYVLISEQAVNLDGVALSTRLASNNYASRPLIKGDAGTSHPLPSGEMSLANLNAYIDGNFRSYVEENYPEDVDLLPGGDPELPTSPSIDFTIPTADLSPLDPSEVISDYSTPVSFWWTLTSDVLDTSGLKWLALFGLSCAIFAYIIWRLGR